MYFLNFRSLNSLSYSYQWSFWNYPHTWVKTRLLLNYIPRIQFLLWWLRYIIPPINLILFYCSFIFEIVYLGSLVHNFLLFIILIYFLLDQFRKELLKWFSCHLLIFHVFMFIKSSIDTLIIKLSREVGKLSFTNKIMCLPFHQKKIHPYK